MLLKKYLEIIIFDIFNDDYNYRVHNNTQKNFELFKHKPDSKSNKIAHRFALGRVSISISTRGSHYTFFNRLCN